MPSPYSETGFELSAPTLSCERCGTPGTPQTLRRPHGVGWWCRQCRDEYDVYLSREHRVRVPGPAFGVAAYIGVLSLFVMYAPLVMAANAVWFIAAFPAMLLSTVAADSARRRRFLRTERRLPRVEVRELPAPPTARPVIERD